MHAMASGHKLAAALSDPSPWLLGLAPALAGFVRIEALHVTYLPEHVGFASFLPALLSSNHSPVTTTSRGQTSSRRRPCLRRRFYHG
jgi:hypothetical protein